MERDGGHCFLSGRGHRVDLKNVEVDTLQNRHWTAEVIDCDCHCPHSDSIKKPVETAPGNIPNLTRLVDVAS